MHLFHHVARLGLEDRFTHELNITTDNAWGLRGWQPGDGVEAGGLAGTVGADQGDDLALVNMKADPVQRLDIAVLDFEIFNLQQHQITSSPRYAVITAGWLRISSGVPSAIVWPKSMTLIWLQSSMTTSMWCSIIQMLTSKLS